MIFLASEGQEQHVSCWSSISDEFIDRKATGGSPHMPSEFQVRGPQTLADGGQRPARGRTADFDDVAFGGKLAGRKTGLDELI